MTINKEHIRKAVDEALSKVLKAQDKINNSDDIVDSTDLEDELKLEQEESVVNTDETSLDSPPPEEPVVDVDVEEKVAETVAAEVGQDAEYSFLGLDISITSEDERLKVTVKKDDFKKTEELESYDLKQILNIIEGFFEDLVISEEFESDDDEDLQSEELKDTEDNVEIEDNDLFEDDELDSGLISSMAALRDKYKGSVDAVFEQGLLAKKLVLDVLKEKLVANTVKDLIDRVKEKDAVVAAKQADLREASLNYLLARQLNGRLEKAYALIAARMKEIKEEIDENEGTLSVENAEKLSKFYSAVIARVVKCTKAEEVDAIIERYEKTTSALLASIVKAKPIVNKVGKKEVNESKDAVIASGKPSNILNKNGWRGNATIMAHRYDGIDEMSAEILHIAGIDD